MAHDYKIFLEFRDQKMNPGSSMMRMFPEDEIVYDFKDSQRIDLHDMLKKAEPTDKYLFISIGDEYTWIKLGSISFMHKKIQERIIEVESKGYYANRRPMLHGLNALANMLKSIADKGVTRAYKLYIDGFEDKAKTMGDYQLVGYASNLAWENGDNANLTIQSAIKYLEDNYDYTIERQIIY